jgi:hypothetical protein
MKSLVERVRTRKEPVNATGDRALDKSGSYLISCSTRTANGGK